MLWDTKLIEEDRAILTEYGLRRKHEIWTTKETVRDFRRRARELNAIRDKSKEQVLLDKVNKLGFVKANSLDDILSLSLRHVLERRLQTLVFKKGLAKTVKQARQLIVHGHIAIAGKKATFPSILVSTSEESQISFYGNFTLKEPQIEEPKTKPADEGAGNTEAVENATENAEANLKESEEVTA